MLPRGAGPRPGALGPAKPTAGRRQGAGFRKESGRGRHRSSAPPALRTPGTRLRRAARSPAVLPGDRDAATPWERVTSPACSSPELSVGPGVRGPSGRRPHPQGRPQGGAAERARFSPRGSWLPRGRPGSPLCPGALPTDCGARPVLSGGLWKGYRWPVLSPPVPAGGGGGVCSPRESQRSLCPPTSTPSGDRTQGRGRTRGWTRMKT